MAIDTNMVKKIAFLSRLRVSEDKIADTEKEFNNILKWIEQLKDVDTANVEPLLQMPNMVILWYRKWLSK